MKLYNSMGPNPKAVRMFISELGLEMDMVEVDLMGAENRQGDYLKVNPAGQTPALELDDGTTITEITAICEYLDELQGSTSLIGTTPEQKAETRMWTRRIDIAILEPMANGFRYGEGQDIFRGRMALIPQAADDLKAIAQERLTWLDGLIAGKEFMCGDRFTMADILPFAFLEFFADFGQPIKEDNTNIVAWLERVRRRPSATA
ncbi:MAG: glutathione S-transferase family protein [Pseudomonadota bacterium]